MIEIEEDNVLWGHYPFKPCQRCHVKAAASKRSKYCTECCLRIKSEAGRKNAKNPLFLSTLETEILNTLEQNPSSLCELSIKLGATENQLYNKVRTLTHNGLIYYTRRKINRGKAIRIYRLRESLPHDRS